jgi:hypothetical protein
MIDLTAPEWSGPIGTGLFGTAYALGDGHSLVLLGAPGNHVGSRPDRAWPWIIMKNRARDFAFEDDLRNIPELAAVTNIQILDKDRLFTASEKDLVRILNLLRGVAQKSVGPGNTLAG